MGGYINNYCFAWNGYQCTALNETKCEGCRFGKVKGTECNTCRHYKKESCKDVEMAACDERRKNRAW